MRIRTAALAATALVVLASCGEYNDKRGRGDAPVASTDDTPAVVVNFPDLFMNVAFKCLGSNGIYTHTREGAPIVVPNDTNCRNGDN